MANYDHFYFKPEFNRLRDSLEGHMSGMNPPRQINQPEVDPDDPYRMIHTGIFQGKVSDSAGKEREYVFYVPATAQHAGNLIFIFTGKDQTAQMMYDAHGWAEILEKYRAVGVFIAPDGDWDKENPGNDMDCVLKVLAESQDNQYFIPTVCAHYALGFGSGAYMASLFSILYGSTLAAFAIDGECGFSEELFELLYRLPSDGDPSVSKAQCPLPAWIIDGSESGKMLLEFMKTANQCSPDFLENDAAKVWLPEIVSKDHPIKGLHANQVWYSNKELVADDKLIERMVSFVVRYKRWRDCGNGNIQFSRSEQELGLVRRNIVAGGLNRHFHIFEPSAYKKGKNRKFPLVIASHGFSCNGPFFADNTSWQAIAEERGFFVVFTTAYPRFNEFFGHRFRTMCPTTCWNAMLEEQDGSAPDDIAYFKEILQIMKNEYPVDMSRIYLTGHSNGAQMTQCLMRLMPKEFAAFAPIGAVESYQGSFAVKMPEDDIIRPVWYMMGEFDMGEGWNLGEGGMNRLAVSKLCACNHADLEKAKTYENGIYRHWVACDEKQVPLVRFTGVEGWPHTYTMEAARMVWDEFFCKFSRNEDGFVSYMGQIVGETK